MAKNLKLNIKNAQLAEALKIGKGVTKTRAKAKEEPKEPPVVSEVIETPVVHTKPEEPAFVEPAPKFEPKPQQAPSPEEKFESPASDEAYEPRRTSYPDTSYSGASSYKPVQREPYKPRNPDQPRPRIEGLIPKSRLAAEGADSGYRPRDSQGGYPPRSPSQSGPYRPREGGGYRPQGAPGQSGSYARPQSQTGGFRPRDVTPGGYRPRDITPREGGYQGPQREGGFNRGPAGFRPAPGFQRPQHPAGGPSAPGFRKPTPAGGYGIGYRGPITALPDANKKTPSRVLDQVQEAKPKKIFIKDVRDAPLKKKIDSKKSFDGRDRQGLTADDGDQWRKKRVYKSKPQLDESEIIRPKKLNVRIPITVKDLAAMMKLKASQLVTKLFMQGVMITLNDFLDDETTIQLLGHEFDCEITIDTHEEDRLKITDKTIREEISESDPDKLVLRAPVVAFMGHVDHGKTSLVDAIRKSNIAAGEAGAITQHIGAFQCSTHHGLITILDTPGHEAFNEMRARGADVTDIVVLVVAGDEGVKPQTLEAINQSREAKVPIVVAITKSDKPNFNLETVYRQLADQELLPEAWGGTTITVPCSSVSKAGINELLEMLALQSEILELKANPQARARGTVIESEMHKGMGAFATLLVQNGTLRPQDALVIGDHFARVKTLMNDHDEHIEEAGPSTPVKITGLSGLPLAGSEFIVVKNEKEARELSEKRAMGSRQLAMQSKRGSVESLIQKSQEGAKKVLPLILKADVQGSLEALKTSLLKIPSTKVELNFISASVGEISESDIALAAASKASIIGFHTDIESHAEMLVKEKSVKVILQDVIYHVVDDVKLLMKAQLDKLAKEEITGKAEVKTIFKASALGVIAGCQVTEGTIRRNAHCRLYRNNEVIWKGPIASLKRVKEDVREVSKGIECGILLSGYSDIKAGDIIEAFDVIYLEQEL